MSLYVGKDVNSNSILHVTSGSYPTAESLTGDVLLDDTVFLSSKNVTEVVDITYTTISATANNTFVPSNVEPYLDNSNVYSVFIFMYNGSTWDPQLNTGMGLYCYLYDSTSYVITSFKQAPWAGKPCAFITVKTAQLGTGGSVFIDHNSFNLGGTNLFSKKYLVYEYVGANTDSSTVFNLPGGSTIGYVDGTTAVSTYMEDDSVGFYNVTGQKVELFSRVIANRVNSFLRSTSTSYGNTDNMYYPLPNVDTSVAYPVSVKMPCTILWDEYSSSPFTRAGYFHMTFNPSTYRSVSHAYAPYAYLQVTWNPTTKILHVLFGTEDSIDFGNVGPTAVPITYFQM